MAAILSRSQCVNKDNTTVALYVTVYSYHTTINFRQHIKYSAVPLQQSIFSKIVTIGTP